MCGQNVQCFEVKAVGLAWPPGAARLASAGARHKEITVTKFNQWVMNKRRTCDRSTEFRRVLSIASADPVLQRHCYELERAKAVIKKYERRRCATFEIACLTCMC